MSKHTRRLGPVSVLVAFALALGGCGDDGPAEPQEGFGAAEKAAVVNALQQSGALSQTPLAGFAGFAGLLLEGVTEVGSLEPGQAAATNQVVHDALDLAVANALAESYEEGFGISVTFDVITQTQQLNGFMTGVVAWNGLSTSANTVDELVMAALFGLETATLTEGTGTIGSQPAEAFGVHWNGSETFFATSGTVDIGPTTFAGPTGDCSTTVQGFTVTCTYQAGTMSGDFEFIALSAQETQYVQSPVSFTNLPAVKVTINVIQG